MNVILENPWRTEADKPEPLPLVFFNDLQPNFTAADFVEGLLIDGSMFVVYGESNCGKTFFATDLGMHVAMGWTWRGRAVEQGGVVYCALEGSHGISNRVAAFRQEHELEGVKVPFAVIPCGIDMRDPGADTERLIDAIHAASKAMGIKVRMVVIDTLARAMGGGNENSPDDMGALVLNTDRVRQATGACVGYIHHCGKDTAKGARGHSSLRAATDTEIEITRQDSGSPSIARAVKQREMDTSGEFPFTLRVVELGPNQRGKPVTSCVVEAQDVAGTPTARPARLSPTTTMALRMLTDALAAHGKPAPPMAQFPAGVEVVPTDTWREEFYRRYDPAASQDAKQKSFRRAVNDLHEKAMAASFNGFVWLVGRDAQ